MAAYDYVVTQNAQGDVLAIWCKASASYVPWSDAGFANWNAQQPTPYTLSAEQQLIQTARAMTRAQRIAWWQSATAAQQGKVISILIDTIPGVV